jgi:hypothetical protein
VKDFTEGSLALASYARPRKLFTGNTRLINRAVGKLSQGRLEAITEAVVKAISGPRSAPTTAAAGPNTPPEDVGTS